MFHHIETGRTEDSTVVPQVWLLRWDGQAALVASFGAGPRAALLGALPDRLLMVRAAPGGRIAMATRATSLLAPLLQSWATLPGSGLLPGDCSLPDVQSFRQQSLDF